MSMDLPIENQSSPLQAIPGPKGRFLTGNLSQINFDELHQYMKEMALEYGPVYRLAFAHKPVVVLSDPEIVRGILKNRPDKFRRISAMEAVFSELGANGVFSSEGEKWKTERKMMNQAFKASKMENYYPIITKSTERLHEVLNKSSENKQPIDMQTMLQRFTVDITSNLAFGYDMNSLNNDDSEFQKNINVIFPMISNRVKAPFPYWRYFKMQKDKELEKAIFFISELSKKFIQSAENNIKSGKTPSNILEAMISARDEQGNSFDQKQLFPNIVTLLLAGEDTTANTLGWIIHYLTKNPKYQDQIKQEIEDKLEEIDLSKPEHLDQFPVLFSVIQEAMRLMPVAPFLYLENNHPETIAGYHIPKNTMVVVLLSQSGHSSEIFDEAEKFKPERWLNFSDIDKKQHSKDLMHFGSGPRQCPGMQLSLIEIKYAMIMLIKNFTFSRDENSGRTQDLFAFTVMPKNLMINVRQR